MIHEPEGRALWKRTLTPGSPVLLQGNLQIATTPDIVLVYEYMPTMSIASVESNHVVQLHRTVSNSRLWTMWIICTTYIQYTSVLPLALNIPTKARITNIHPHRRMNMTTRNNDLSVSWLFEIILTPDRSCQSSMLAVA